MSVILPSAPAQYDARDQSSVRRAIREADALNQKTNQDITIQDRRLILIAPDGGQWAVTVNNSGVLGTTSL
jgi:hypothetical protein